MPPPACCIPECSQRGYRDNFGNKVSFHKFPRSEAMFQKWVSAINGEDSKFLNVTKSVVVCSRHFLPSDFQPKINARRRLLHETAVPSLFSFKMAKKSPKRSSPLPLRHFKQDPAQPSEQRPVRSTGLESACPSQDTDSSETPPPMSDCGDEDFSGSDSSVPPIGEETDLPLPLVCEVADCPFVREVETLKCLVARQEKEISNLTKQLEYTRKELKEAKHKYYRAQGEKDYALNKLREEEKKKANFCVERFAESNNEMMYYTGLPSYRHFTALLAFLKPGEYGEIALNGWSRAKPVVRGRPQKLTVENQLFLVLVRLQINTPLLDLAHRFIVGFSTAHRIFASWVEFMHLKLSATSLGHSESTAQQVVPGTPVEQCGVPSSPIRLSSASLDETQIGMDFNPLDVVTTVYDDGEEVDSVASANGEQQQCSLKQKVRKDLPAPEVIAPFLPKLHKAVIEHLARKAEEIPDS
ncbi:unnamed protein product [Ixodes pacificus]